MLRRTTPASPSERRPREPAPAAPSSDARGQRRRVRALLFERIDAGRAAALTAAQLGAQIDDAVRQICDEQRLQLSQQEEASLCAELLAEMTGVGPLQALLDDEQVTDIMVNGPRQVFVERGGRLELSGASFADEEQLFNTAQRIAAAVGRRIDEANPMVDARLPDGSRVNIISPPLAIDGTSMSIRKFSRQHYSLGLLAARGAMSPAMAELLSLAMRARQNLIVSGGTGAGKTTLLNAMSEHIGEDERIVTIEDAAELQLQQAHLVRLETRPENVEGLGHVGQRELMRNALRMRPDRIILGEIRGAESFDMLQAMNTGHDGSLCTVHANSPRDALLRIENMVMMAGLPLPLGAIRRQVASALNLIVQVERMRDGVRRVVSICEIQGMEQDVIQMQELFGFEASGMDEHGLRGAFVERGQRARFLASHAHLLRGRGAR